MFLIERNGKIINWYNGQFSIDDNRIKVRGSTVYFPADQVNIHEIPNQDLSHLKDEDGEIEGDYPDDVATFSASEKSAVKLRGQTYAKIAEIDTSRSDKKYLKVEKTIDGNTYSVWAYADYSLLLAYQNNDIATGDIVIIEFVDNELNKCYAQGKVVGF